MRVGVGTRYERGRRVQNPPTGIRETPNPQIRRLRRWPISPSRLQFPDFTFCFIERNIFYHVPYPPSAIYKNPTSAAVFVNGLSKLTYLIWKRSCSACCSRLSGSYWLVHLSHPLCWPNCSPAGACVLLQQSRACARAPLPPPRLSPAHSIQQHLLQELPPTVDLTSAQDDTTKSSLWMTHGTIYLRVQFRKRPVKLSIITFKFDL